MSIQVSCFIYSEIVFTIMKLFFVFTSQHLPSAPSLAVCPKAGRARHQGSNQLSDRYVFSSETLSLEF